LALRSKNISVYHVEEALMVPRARLLVFCLCGVLGASSAVLGQQRGTINGRVLDSAGLALPGATITVTNQSTGFTRSVVSAETGAFAVPNLDPGTYTVTVDMPSFSSLKQTDLALTAGSTITIEPKMQIAAVQEQITVTGESPLVERTSNQIGGTLSSREIEEVPSNFRNFTGLTQLIPGMTPNPAASSFEGGQVVANGTPSQQNVYLLDGMYNNDDRLGGSQGTQVRVVLDNIEEYQVLSNQYSAEYGGGAGAIINMVTRGGTNNLNGRAYSYFRDDRFNARNAFLPDAAPKPDERTLQAGFGVGGPIIRNRAHFYFTMEKDHEDIAGQKRFPPATAPLATDFVGTFSVRATNYFGRGDVQLNDNNFVNVRWLLETAPTRGEGFNTNNETIDAQQWESDWDHLVTGTYTSVFSDRATNVVRVGRIGEELGTGAQAFFDDNVNQIGFAGRSPFSIGQRNVHPSYVTGRGGEGLNTVIRTYVVDESLSYFVPSLWGSEHTFKAGGGISFNQMPPRTTFSSGTFQFQGRDTPYNPANPATYPTQFDVTVGPPSEFGYAVTSKDRRTYLFLEDKWRMSKNVTLNLGVRYDNQRQTPGTKDAVAPRLGFAWDVTGNGMTVVRGGGGKFYAYPPVVLDLTLQQNGLETLFPTISINAANDTCGCVLRPDMITDSQGNPGVASLSAAGQADINARRDAAVAGTQFNRNPWVDSETRRLPYTWSYSFGVSRQIMRDAAVSVDYVANESREQLGVIDINEPVNGIRPGVAVFDPTGSIIPPEARSTPFARVLQVQTSPVFDGDYKSLQLSLVKRHSNRWSGRVAYTLQQSKFVGSSATGGAANPDARRVWLDNEPRADYGRFASDRLHVFASSASVNPWRSLTVATVVSAISGAAINEIVGRDVNGDLDNNDRPIRGIDDRTLPIVSEVDSAGRAVINGLQGPGSFLVDVSFRYAIPLRAGLESVDLFYDIFNVLNRENLVNPTGNRSSGTFMVSTAAQFPRQMQFGIRVRF
jgi:Carboxypeptidase regulatory-like domain/TonB-dependent Receptor Plug Domain/TonB dependent receptor